MFGPRDSMPSELHLYVVTSVQSRCLEGKLLQGKPPEFLVRTVCKNAVKATANNNYLLHITTPLDAHDSMKSLWSVNSSRFSFPPTCYRLHFPLVTHSESAFDISLSNLTKCLF